MSGIRGRDTQPEMRVRRYLHASGFRYRLHDRSLPGIPDLVFRQHHTVIFVHGCYWHRHTGCRYATTPSSNKDFWLRKLEGNVRRDREVIKRLLDEQWRVIVVWECGLRGVNIEEALQWLPQTIRTNAKQYVEWPVNAG